MPEYDIDPDLLSEIEGGASEAADLFGDSGTIDTEQLSNEQMAYLSTNPEYVEQMMTDLGITDAGEYTQFIQAYDPWKQDLAQKKWLLGKDKLMSDTRQGLLAKLGDPLEATSYAAKGGFEAMGQDQGGYLSTLEGLDVEGAEQSFQQGLAANTLGRQETTQGALQDYSDMFYRDVGDIYAQQQADTGGGKK